jgi:hypothetical protein
LFHRLIFSYQQPLQIGLFSVPAPPPYFGKRRGFLLTSKHRGGDFRHGAKLFFPRPPLSMTDSLWQFTPPLARLQAEKLRAALDTTQPQRGLTDLRLEDQTPAGQILQLELAPGKIAAEEPSEVYVRRHDLIATYPQTPTRPFRPQIYWRFVSDAGTESLGGVEVIASVQSSLLESRAAIDAVTTLPAAEVLAPADATLRAFAPLENLAGQPFALASAARPACLLFRLPESRASYVEMVPPSDFQTLHLLSQADGAVLLRYSLFGQFLEKGVILRARRRGVFVPRDHDTDAAARCYEAFVRSAPPLTT